MAHDRKTPEEIKRAARAIRAHTTDHVNQHVPHVRYGVLDAVSPIKVTVPGFGTFDESAGDVSMGDFVKFRHSKVPLAKGDTVVVMLVDDDWHIIDVLSGEDFSGV
jgi:hypothetical protein